MQDLLIVSGLLLSPLLALSIAALLRLPLKTPGRLALRWCALALFAGALTVQLIVWLTPEPILAVPFMDEFELGVKTPLLEEGLKALVLVLLCLSPAIADEVDGATFGAFVGLGFALLENHRFFTIAPDFDILMMLYATRTFLATSGHALTTALVGAALGAFVARRTASRLAAVPIAFAGAVAIHGVQNVFGPVTSQWWFVPAAVAQLCAFALLYRWVLHRKRKLTAVTENTDRGQSTSSEVAG